MRAAPAAALALAALLAALTVLVVAGDHTGGADAEVAEWVTAWREPWLTDLMRVATRLGSLPVLAPVLLAVGLWAGRGRGLRPLVFLAAALGGAALLNMGMKALIGRPRPDVEALVDAPGSGFPSGHSAQAAAAWLAVAVVLSALARGPAARAAIVVIAVLLVVVVGLSRVYLGVHAPADVLAGWALGAGWVAAILAWGPRPGPGPRPPAGGAQTSLRTIR